MKRTVLTSLLLACLLVPGLAQARLKAESTDPLVLLEEAKLTIADGKLSKAQEQLASIPLENVEEYVVQEVLFQQLLLSAAMLRATDFLLRELVNDELFETGYADYLVEERGIQAQTFEQSATRFIELTEADTRLEFVRFRLPQVTVEHLRDVDLYSDVEMLTTAANSWEKDQQRLGKGLINAQARVALVLVCARYYDMEEASATIEAVARRLLEGVPVDAGDTVGWIAEFSYEVANPADDLEALSELASASLARRLAGPVVQADAELNRAPALKPVGKASKLRRGNKQSNDPARGTSE